MFGFGEDTEMLLIASMGQVFSWDGRRLEHAGGSGYASCLAECGEELYEGGIGAVRKFSSVRSRYVGERIADTESCVALCATGGTLIHATNGSPGNPVYEVRETLSGNVLAARNSDIMAVTLHDGLMYDAGYYGVCETQPGTIRFEGACSALASHAGSLYVAKGMVVHDVDSNSEVFSAVESGLYCRRISTLCSYQGTLLAALDGEGNQCIVDVSGNRIYLDWREAYSSLRRQTGGPIEDMIPVRRSILMRKGRMRKGTGVFF